MFLPTATMANHIAFGVLGQPGEELLAEETSHVLTAESGGAARHSGLSAGSGSGSTTSMPAPAIVPLPSAATRSAVTVLRPRPTLMK